jgi:hypothetical protein
MRFAIGISSVTVSGRHEVRGRSATAISNQLTGFMATSSGFDRRRCLCYENTHTGGGIMGMEWRYSDRENLTTGE